MNSHLVTHYWAIYSVNYTADISHLSDSGSVPSYIYWTPYCRHPLPPLPYTVAYLQPTAYCAPPSPPTPTPSSPSHTVAYYFTACNIHHIADLSDPGRQWARQPVGVSLSCSQAVRVSVCSLLAYRPTNRQSQPRGRMGSDKLTCCHTECDWTVAADQTCYLSPSLSADTGVTKY